MGGFSWAMTGDLQAAEKVRRSISRIALLREAENAKRAMEPYVPKDTGALVNSAVALVDEVAGCGRVIYTAPHAAACYYGETVRFRTDGHLLATAFWDRAAGLSRGGAVGGR